MWFHKELKISCSYRWAKSYDIEFLPLAHLRDDHFLLFLPLHQARDSRVRAVGRTVKREPFPWIPFPFKKHLFLRDSSYPTNGRFLSVHDHWPTLFNGRDDHYFLSIKGSANKRLTGADPMIDHAFTFLYFSGPWMIINKRSAHPVPVMVERWSDSRAQEAFHFFLLTTVLILLL